MYLADLMISLYSSILMACSRNWCFIRLPSPSKHIKFAGVHAGLVSHACKHAPSLKSIEGLYLTFIIHWKMCRRPLSVYICLALYVAHTVHRYIFISTYNYMQAYATFYVIFGWNGSAWILWPFTWSYPISLKCLSSLHAQRRRLSTDRWTYVI